MMVLFNIAKKNIEKNVKGYFLYFISIVFTVCIYYTFRSLQYNPSIDSVLAGSSKASTAFNSASVIIALFSVLFVAYSNSFFIKKRKKEIGLYALLGIENREIGILLFFETVMIGTGALLIGIIVGIVFSKVMLSILIKIIGLNLNIPFVVSFKAIFNTCVIFISLFLIIAFQSYRIIYKFKLIELFEASKVSEKSKGGSKFLAKLSIVLIVLGYINYILVLKGSDIVIAAIITLCTVVLGTFLFFSSFMYFVVKKEKRDESKYYKGLNMISTSQLVYRIKSNAKMLSIVSILSATTLTSIGVSMSTYFMTSENVEKDAPFSYTLKIDDENYIREIEDMLSDKKDHELINKSKFSYLKLLEYKSDSDTGYTDEYEVISVSNLNKLLDLKGKKELEGIEDNEFIQSYPEGSDYLHESYINIDDNGKKLKLSNKFSIDEKLYNTQIPQSIIIVSDNVFEYLKSNNEVNNYYLYNITNEKNSEELNDEVLKITEKYATGEYAKPVDSLVNSYYSTFKEAFAASGIMVFIGVFVGLVFLVCTSSVIFFKLLSEAQDEAPRYKILQKMGVDDKDIKTSVYKQVGFNFFTPLLIGSVHSVVANYVVCKMFGQSLIIVMMCTIIPYVLIYIIYYLVTSRFYFDTVSNKN